MDGDSNEVFPAEDHLFKDSFSADKTFTFFGQKCIINEVFGGNLGVAASVWDAGIEMCRFLERECVEVCGKRVMELGAGSGLVSILAARLGARVTVTDLPEVLPHTVRNIDSNTPLNSWPAGPPTVLPLFWGRDLEQFSSQWDLVLGSDIVYIPETFPLLLHTLVHLSKCGAVVYLSSKMRREHHTHEFYNTLLPQRFLVELVHRDAHKNINIYRATLSRTQKP
ncbi:hypothetical protein AMELA_G00005360 [Ameiurus melas]|uniref:EEF1A lysine methyltransferase 3 n=1 Tax=Ameiurus melas TaxID=219545 RepID=A0A7J6BGJ0_AMEME|nr:hypothetical protein AMELA_G00005360 [Ameiurus melas]